jgi:hypothetical protein
MSLSKMTVANDLVEVGREIKARVMRRRQMPHETLPRSLRAVKEIICLIVSSWSLYCSDVTDQPMEERTECDVCCAVAVVVFGER